MTLLLLGLVFGWLLLALIQGQWRDGLLITVVIGFLQDPIRKLTPGQPGLFVGLALLAAVLTTAVLFSRRGRFGFRAMFATAPALADLAPLYLLLVLAQAANSFVRLGQPTLSLVGLGFYLAPALGLWLGYQTGLSPIFLRRLFVVYLTLSALVAVTVFLDYRGLQHPLFVEVGGGILIHFRYGFYTYGASGLWRTSELAAWHLAASACFALCFAFSSRNPGRGTALGLLAAAFTLLTLFTGRRKALILVVVFLGLYILLLSLRADPRSRQRVVGLLFSVAGLGALAFSLFLFPGLGADFGEYTARGSTGFTDAGSRFQTMVLGALPQAFAMSGGVGLGAGALAQTGSLALDRTGISGNTAYVSESGAGKIIAELGLPGLVLITAVLWYTGGLLRRNLGLLRQLPPSIAVFQLGLFCFGIANIPFYASASGVYGDPFVLIMITLSVGSILAVPYLSESFHRLHFGMRLL
jgi:hypothetical protein